MVYWNLTQQCRSILETTSRGKNPVEIQASILLTCKANGQTGMKKYYLLIIFFSAAFFSSAQVFADNTTVFVREVNAPITEVYKRVFNSLENNGYFVIIEPNIGKNLAHFAERWGKEYNQNELESIRSMVFCNGWYANQVSNMDPDMLALCPLHITLYYKEGKTRIVFIRPSQIAQESPAYKVALELEQDVIRTIEEGLPK